MAESVASVVPAGRPVVVLGHSLGGVLALTMASGEYGVHVVAACGLGIKLRWSPAELAKAAELAARPERVFATREEAVDRWLKVSGLAAARSSDVRRPTDGLMSADSPRVAAGVVRDENGWRVAVDPRAFGVGAPDVPALLAGAKGKTLLAAGEEDPMCPPEHLLDVAPDAVVLPGAGHNAHVENPSALWPLLDSLVA